MRTYFAKFGLYVAWVWLQNNESLKWMFVTMNSEVRRSFFLSSRKLSDTQQLHSWPIKHADPEQGRGRWKVTPSSTRTIRGVRWLPQGLQESTLFVLNSFFSFPKRPNANDCEEVFPVVHQSSDRRSGSAMAIGKHPSCCWNCIRHSSCGLCQLLTWFGWHSAL